MDGTNGSDPYCGATLNIISENYKHAHGYVSLIVCIFGSVANLLNIVVLTRREMSSPTNAILTGLAVADLLVMVEYVPFSCHMYFQDSKSKDSFSYGWAVFVLIHSNFAQVFHTISIWLTVTLAIWRYIAIAYPQRNREWCGMQRTIIAIASGYLLCPVICIPLYLAFMIRPFVAMIDEDGRITYNNESIVHNETLFRVDLSDLGRAKDSFLSELNFLVYSVVIKLIPCFALTILSIRLISALLAAKKRREALTCGSRSTRNVEQERQTDRTTRMLLAVLLLFLITEFPQGILGLLNVILGHRFFMDCYLKFGEIMDILALINSAINFMIYCAMSRQFRTTFRLLFMPKWLPVSQVENGHNNHTTTMVTQV